MALTTPYVDYTAIRNNILTLLRDNISTLNSGLTNTIAAGGTVQIIPGEPSITPMPINLYPVIMVKIVNKSEDFLQLGHAGRKRPIVTYNIYGITAEVESDTDAEIMALIKNIEAVFRDNIVISGTIYTNLRDADFGYSANRGVYVDVVKIGLECTVEIK